MTTYYVDGNGSNGSNSYDGTEADYVSGTTGPWETVDHAQGQLSEGDVLWVAPGTYREAVQFDVAGSSGNIIEIRGDPNCIKGWDSSVVPGRVRITKCNVSEVPQTGALIDFNAKDYIYLYDLYLDGVEYTSSSDIVVNGDSAQTNQKLFRCSVVGGYYGCQYVSGDQCFVLGGESALYNCSIDDESCKFTNSIIMSSYYALNNSDAENCYLAAGYTVVYGASIATNCTILSGYDGSRSYSSDDMTLDGCLVFCLYKIWNSQLETYENPTHTGNLFLIAEDQGLDDTTDFSTEDNRQIYTKDTCSNPPSQGHVFMFPDPLTMLRGLAQAFHITDFNDYGIDDSDSSTESYDIEGRDRGTRASEDVTPGCTQIPQLSISDTNEIKIVEKGEEVLYVPVETGTAITISVDVTTDQTSAYPKIQLLEPKADGGWNELDVDTATTSPDTLEVSGYPADHDKVCILKLITLDTTADSYTKFDNIQIS